MEAAQPAPRPPTAKVKLIRGQLRGTSPLMRETSKQHSGILRFQATTKAGAREGV